MLKYVDDMNQAYRFSSDGRGAATFFFLSDCRRVRTKAAGILLFLYNDTPSVLLQYIP